MKNIMGDHPVMSESTVDLVDAYIGKKILNFRKKRRITQDSLADMIGVSRQLIQKYETGNAKVSVCAIHKIGKALGIKTEEFFREIDELPIQDTQPAAYVQETRQNPLNILVVEDSGADEHLLRKAIVASGKPSNIYSVNNGADALDKLRRSLKGSSAMPLPDLIFLDINLPRMHGDELLQSIKSNAQLRHIPVVAITNAITTPQMLKVYKTGASGYIVKSFSAEEFNAKVEVIMCYWATMVLPAM